MNMWSQLINNISAQDVKSLARAISLIENEVAGYQDFLQKLPVGKTPVTGITGPPGAGKSTLVDALIGAWVAEGKKVAVLCVDPSSPFHLGALLGDRIRMSEWYNEPLVFIRSLASRGALGGLHPHILDIVTLLQAAGFDQILVETVGVGQSEIDITGLADTTVVVLVPEAGDEVQTMKAGLMEIADIFVVNKSDRPDAGRFVKNLLAILPHPATDGYQIPVLQTIASKQEGIVPLMDAIIVHQHRMQVSARKAWLLTERAFQLIQQDRMRDINKTALKSSIASAMELPDFNLFRFIAQQFPS
ncbi:MAG: methylmalonyl Co-A mutase-associated GTPase MeaB [Bacteroidetes bacterium 24-39-8]|nr:MAG: methylmalonyl Co-A mutase-associated GTPase MeaB [Sphingobacteriia bacterium 35-40-8]OYZ50475.1 MAG: methylmalonyl Co-A mutase-associated GTPase MeaB [Bacteroidetes bacterium 24-39-8]OZA68481.1 MAG: methylmalonyl Co-A mutase-associated GTPase MeaB [Sphingobacteriia bacterium 39-39-8]